MDMKKIRRSLDQIEKMEAALSWLQQYGVQLTGRDDSQAYVTVHLNFAGSCPGRAEAAATMASYFELEIPNIVETSIRNCENTIEIHKAAINSELGLKGGA